MNFRHLISSALVLTGCSTVSVQEYKNESPKLDLEAYLNGDLTAHGFFQDRSGKIVQRFEVSMNATWKNNLGTLNEDFVYSDGKTSKRVWTLKKVAPNTFTGTAADVVGEAKGEVAGNAFQWNYTLRLPVNGTTYDVQFDDWMYLMDQKVMLNKSKMYKFGIYLGEVTLVFLKK